MINVDLVVDKATWQIKGVNPGGDGGGHVPPKFLDWGGTNI